MLQAILDMIQAIFSAKSVKTRKGGDPKVSVKPKSIDPLLELIRDTEANGNYSAVYGSASNRNNPKVIFMTIKEILRWQDRFVRQGSRSSAIGAYQFIRKTIRGLVRQGVVAETDFMDISTQDKMATALLRGRGLDKWKEGKLSNPAFANNLAKEWASFPVIGGPKHGRSYYAGDGLNKALISPTKILEVLKECK